MQDELLDPPVCRPAPHCERCAQMAVACSLRALWGEQCAVLVVDLFSHCMPPTYLDLSSSGLRGLDLGVGFKTKLSLTSL